ncbi:MAG: flagellar basal body P-ring formation chaperone FlgA [Gammaproteobacteria bacterium]
MARPIAAWRVWATSVATVTATVLCAAAPLAATTMPALQDLGSIATAAESAVAAHGPGVRATAGSVDERLRLAACDRPLETTLPSAAKGARVSVRVACAGVVTWSVLVPVQVATEGKVVVARRALLPGTLLTEADLTTTERRIPGLADCCATDPAPLLGQRVRRPIAADAPVALDSLEAAPLVRRGEIVTVIAGAPGFEVRSSGVALADARQGDAVRIRHATSLRIIQARADSRGVVRADR